MIWDLWKQGFTAGEQATGLQEVNTAVNEMDQATQQNAAMAEQSTAASQALAHLSPPVAEGNITRQEAVYRADQLFDALDANHDGFLTRGEAMITGMRLRAERASTGVDIKPGIGGHTERFLEHRFAGERTIRESRPMAPIARGIRKRACDQRARRDDIGALPRGHLWLCGHYLPP